MLSGVRSGRGTRSAITAEGLALLTALSVVGLDLPKGYTGPLNGPTSPRYAVIDLGTNFPSPIKITDSGYVLQGGTGWTGMNNLYGCVWHAGQTLPLQPSANFDPAEYDESLVSDIAEDGTVVGIEVIAHDTSSGAAYSYLGYYTYSFELAVWPSGTATPSITLAPVFTSGNWRTGGYMFDRGDNTITDISLLGTSPLISPNDIWTVQITSVSWDTAGFQNQTGLGTGVYPVAVNNADQCLEEHDSNYIKIPIDGSNTIFLHLPSVTTYTLGNKTLPSSFTPKGGLGTMSGTNALGTVNVIGSTVVNNTSQNVCWDGTNLITVPQPLGTLYYLSAVNSATTTVTSGTNTPIAIPATQVVGNGNDGGYIWNLAPQTNYPPTSAPPTFLNPQKLDTLVVGYGTSNATWSGITAASINQEGAIVGTAAKDDNSDGVINVGRDYFTGVPTGPDYIHGVLLLPIELDLVNRDDLTQTWTANEQKQAGLVTVYAGTTTGDEVAWKLNAPSSWLSGTFTWTATDSNGTVINGPTGVGKDHWQISDTGGNDPAGKTSLTWKPDTYTIKCNIVASGGGTIPIQFTQKVGWRTEDYLVIGQIVTTHHYDGSGPTLSGGGGGFTDDYVDAIAYDLGDNLSSAGYGLAGWVLPSGSGTALTTLIENTSIPTDTLGMMEFGFWGSVGGGSNPQGPFGTSYPNNQGIMTADERWWMMQNALNFSVDDPSGAPSTIPATSLSTLEGNQQYRLFHHYQTRFCLTSAGKIDTGTLHDIHNDAQLGTTKINWSIAANTYSLSVTTLGVTVTVSNPQIGPFSIPAASNPKNGNVQTSTDGTQRSSYSSGRIGLEGQNANWRVFGQDVPWIFSEIIAQVASDHTVTSSIKMSVNQTWLTTGPVSGQHNFNNLNIYKATTSADQSGTVTVTYTPQTGSPISMDGQVEPFIDSVPAGTWPNAPPNPTVQ